MNARAAVISIALIAASGVGLLAASPVPATAPSGPMAACARQAGTAATAEGRSLERAMCVARARYLERVTNLPVDPGTMAVFLSPFHPGSQSGVHDLPGTVKRDVAGTCVPSEASSNPSAFFCVGDREGFDPCYADPADRTGRAPLLCGTAGHPDLVRIRHTAALSAPPFRDIRPVSVYLKDGTSAMHRPHGTLGNGVSYIASVDASGATWKASITTIANDRPSTVEKEIDSAYF